MIKARILWILWLIFSGLFWFWSEDYLGILLPILSLMVPVLGCLITKLSTGYLQAWFSVDVAGEKNHPVKGMLFLKNTGILPVGRVRCEIKGENLLTGEVFRFKLAMAAPARMTAKEELELMSRHCGKIRFSLEKLTVRDPFGLWNFSVPASGEEVTLIRPEIFPVETQIVYGESLSLDSDMFSMVKPGSDSSEIFAVREYRPGDRIRQMHWKLSEKLDISMVKEYGLPIQNTILLALETGIAPGMENLPADCMDALAESLLSLSESLMEEQVVHSIAWYNHEEKEFYCEEVNDQSELMALYPQVLSAAPGEDASSVMSHYMEQHEQCEFAHVVIFTPYHLPDLSAFEGYSLVTEVICEQKAAGVYREQGVLVISVTPDSKEEELVYLEI